MDQSHKGQQYIFYMVLVTQTVVTVGDSGVGKTNLVFRFCRDEFNGDNKPTIGVEFYTRLICAEGNVIKLQIWDTAGQERYRAIVNSYYRAVEGAFLVFDVTRKETFDNIQMWLQNIKQTAPEECAVILVGNKSDCVDKRCLQYDEIKYFADKNGLCYIETSALNSTNVKEAFQLLINEMFRKQKSLDNKEIPRRPVTVALKDEPPNTKAHGCCYQFNPRLKKP